MTVSIDVLSAHEDVSPAGSIVFIGRHGALQRSHTLERLPKGVSPSTYRVLLGDTAPRGDVRVRTHWQEETPTRTVVGVLPEACSRHNTPSRAWAIPRILGSAGHPSSMTIVLALEDAAHAPACIAAIARTWPIYRLAQGRRERKVEVKLLVPEGQSFDARSLNLLARAVQRAAQLVDTPPNELNTTNFVSYARQSAAQVEGVHFQAITGDFLRTQGMGGVWAVGKAAVHPPSLVILDLDGTNPDLPREVWVGKGITYDTGGLSLKTKTGMPGMKSDMGGAAAVLTAFLAAASMGSERPLTAILCLAENAVGPQATRPDDVIQMYSGRRVEVNNTDAEGRLVLADGVAWAVSQRSPGRIIDMATLTGAQSMATGKMHAALYCNDETLEAQAVQAGRRTGDMTHALPFVPEFYVNEFRSHVADLKNSVKDRFNAQSSCAGEFIRQHILDYEGQWLHVDMAGPSFLGGKGTGWGVAFLLGLGGYI